MNEQIASASEEQSAMSAEINNNVENINSLVAESAQGTREIAENAVNLSNLAIILRESISRFKI